MKFVLWVQLEHQDIATVSVEDTGSELSSGGHDGSDVGRKVSPLKTRFLAQAARLIVPFIELEKMEN